MNKTFKAIIVLVIGLLSLTANASIVSVSGPDSSEGVAPAIISAPENVLDSDVSNLGMEGFDEAQDVVTTVAHNIDGGGSIPADTLVDSHMIFLNKPDGVGGTLTHANVTWTFDGIVIGVMSNSNGSLEVASSSELGASTTTYPTAPFSARGMESGDSYVVSSNTITVTMTVSQPGDWIRVITTPLIELEIDIKPGSCPNPLNVKSQGVLPVAILGTEDLDVTDIDVDTISLAGVAPIRFDYEDVATPFEGELCDCHEDGPDGYFDLTLKFDTQEIVTALGYVEDGEYLPLKLSATLVDSTVIEGCDCIRIIKKGKN
jgi:hypothetical protein